MLGLPATRRASHTTEEWDGTEPALSIVAAVILPAVEPCALARRVLSGTLGYSRVLSGTPGYSRLLSGTPGYSRLLSGTPGYSRALSVWYSHALLVAVQRASGDPAGGGAREPLPRALDDGAYRWRACPRPHPGARIHPNPSKSIRWIQPKGSNLRCPPQSVQSPTVHAMWRTASPICVVNLSSRLHC